MEKMERNLKLYTFWVIFTNALFWYPVFFLYFQSLVTLDQVLLLEAIYYFSVVIWEVPSGYLSDRLGRTWALRLSALALCGAYTSFATATGFAGLVVGQIFIAIGFASSSGSDTSYHLGVLESLGRASEYGDREARYGSLSQVAVAVACIAGGAIAMQGLDYTYWASLGGAVVLLAVAFSLREPTQERASTLRHQATSIINALKNRRLAWLFLVACVMTVLVHLPYEFYQPYVATLFSSEPTIYTPLITGLHAAAAMLVAAGIVSRSVSWTDRFGIKAASFGAAIAILTILIFMSQLTHWWVVGLLVFRSAPWVFLKPVLNRAVVPNIEPEIRATYLSVQSLFGRISFGAVLVGLSMLADADWKLDQLLIAAVVISGVLIALMAVTSFHNSAPIDTAD